MKKAIIVFVRNEYCYTYVMFVNESLLFLCYVKIQNETCGNFCWLNMDYFIDPYLHGRVNSWLLYGYMAHIRWIWFC